MKCCVCHKKPATVHLTEIIGEEVQKLDFCEPCAKAKGVTHPASFAMSELVLGPKPQSTPIDLGTFDLRLLFNPLVNRKWLNQNLCNVAFVKKSRPQSI
jgi:hypothetical protein